MWREKQERKTLIEQTEKKTFFVDSAYWQFIKDENGIAFLDANVILPPLKEVKDLFTGIIAFYRHIENEYGSIDAFNAKITEEREKEEESRREKERQYTKPKRGNDGYIYLIRSEMGSYKIGMSRQLDKRMNTFGVKLPFKTELIFSFYTDDMNQTERELHAKFEAQRVNGEWFVLSDEDIEFIKNFSAR